MEKKRINRFDNLKGFLIIIVVFVHVMLQRSFIRDREFPICLMIEAIIFSCTMPAFCFISGMFTTKKWTREGWAEKIVVNLFVPYVIFNLLWWALFSRSLNTLFNPWYHLWYLLSLFCWRLMVIPFSKIRFSFLFSIAAALICGFTPADRFLSISRTICFFPYFLAGYYADKETIIKLGNGLWRKILAAGVMISLFLLVVILQRKGLPMIQFAYNRDPYAFFDLSNMNGVLLRSLGYFTGFSLTICLIVLMTDKECFLTYLGKNTMTLYIIHAFIIKIYEKILKKAGIWSSMGQTEFLLFTVIMTAALCFLLSRQSVMSIYQKVMDAVTGYFVKNEQTSLLQK